MNYDYETNIRNFQKYFEQVAWFIIFLPISLILTKRRWHALCSWGAPQLTQFSLDSKILSDPKTMGPFACNSEPLSRDNFSLARNRAPKWGEIGHATKKELFSASRNGSNSVSFWAKPSFLDRKHVQNGPITPTQSLNLEINCNTFGWNVMEISRLVYW